jgi:uncharacterized protein YkwD
MSTLHLRISLCAAVLVVGMAGWGMAGLDAAADPAAAAALTPLVEKPAPPTVAPPVEQTPAPPLSAASPADTASFASEVVDLVNIERAKAGCPLLAVDNTLTSVALAHSTDMAVSGFFTHTNLLGQTPGDRMTAAGYVWRQEAENIAGGQRNPAEAVTSWMNSPGHRANILTCSLCETGVGYYYSRTSQYGHYWTQVFAVPGNRDCKPPQPPEETATFTPTPTKTATPTLTPTATKTKRPPPGAQRHQFIPVLNKSVARPPAGPVIRNGDFESGPDGSWSESSTQFGNEPGDLIARQLPDGFANLFTGFRPYAGAYVAWLGGVNDETSVLGQAITFPAVAGMHLRFAMFIASYEQDCDRDFATIVFAVPGRDPELLYRRGLCGVPYPKWAIVDGDLDSNPNLCGQSGRLEFRVVTNGSNISHFFVDNVVVYRKTGAE